MDIDKEIEHLEKLIDKLMIDDFIETFETEGSTLAGTILGIAALKLLQKAGIIEF